MKFDVRVSEKLLQDGTLDTKDYEKYLKELPDESANMSYISVFDEETEQDAETTEPIEGLTFISG
ncbi:MAG: hypothetical protein BWY40_00940 [bacterium ADurb.Bin270]|nr:MAG: hypothetical protein BWY40_00940 [bacterium ADurb.Bin270]